MDNPNSTPIYQILAPMSASLEALEPMIITSSYELHPCLVAIGQSQPFSTARVISSYQEGNVPKVLSSDQVGNELLATLRESFNLTINLGLDLQDPVLLKHLYMGLDNTVLGGVFLSLSLSKVRFVLIISGHTPCTNLHDEILEIEKESSPKPEEEVFIATLQTFQSHDSAIYPKPAVLQIHHQKYFGRSFNFPLHKSSFSTYSLNLLKRFLRKLFKSNPFEGQLERLKDGMSSDAIEGERNHLEAILILSPSMSTLDIEYEPISKPILDQYGLYYALSPKPPDDSRNPSRYHIHRNYQDHIEAQRLESIKNLCVIAIGWIDKVLDKINSRDDPREFFGHI